MASISVQTSSNGNGNRITATVNYAVSSTNDTHTLTLSSVKTVMSGNTANNPYADVTVTVTYGSTQLYKGTLYTSTSTDGSASLSTSSNTSKTHSAQSKALKVSVSAATRWYDGSSRTATLSGSNSENVSIAARPSYTVTYNANSGSGAPSSQTKWYGETLTLSNAKPTRSNYVFKRWNTNTSDSGTAYNSGASYTGNAALTLYAIWNPIISYDGQGGSNVPAAQTKTYGTNLTLSSNVPTKVGYRFLHWSTNSAGTGTNYSAGGTYSSNTAATLYAIWQRVAQAPAISSISVVRCTSGGTADDSGTYCKVTAAWSVDTASAAGMSSNTGTVTGTIKVDGSSSSTAITFSSGASGTSGTAIAIVPNCDTDKQYVVTVTVTNSVIGTGDSAVLSTSRTDILTRAFFTMDFAAGGRGVGVGVAAPTQGFECGFDAQFDGTVEALGNVTAPNLTLTEQKGTSVASASSSWSFDAAYTYGYRYGPFAMVSIYAKTNNALTAGTSYTIGTLASAYVPKRPVGYGNQYGHGYINSSSIYFTPSVAVSANTYMYIGTMFVANQ